MRARMALVQAGIDAELREISLSNKPAAFLKTSPKGTVPVLVLPEGQVLEESLDIIDWVYHEAALSDWGWDKNHTLIQENDTEFTRLARPYKYPDRYPEGSQSNYRDACLPFLEKVEAELSKHAFVLDEKPSFVDIGIFPFIRQFMMVDEAWFERSPYQALKKWCDYWGKSKAYHIAMKKWPLWEEGAVIQRLL
jgi:glutathione S-transferase